MPTAQKEEQHEFVSNHPAHEPGKVHTHDVMCGRGGQSNIHPGNEWFRRLVRSNRALYRSCPKHTKLLVSKAIVQAVQQQDPPGRFMKLRPGEKGDDFWEPITYKEAVNKTSQALREKDSSDIKSASKRKKLAEEQRSIQERRIGATKRNGKQTPKNLMNPMDSTIQSIPSGPVNGMTASSNGAHSKSNTAGQKRKSPMNPSWWRIGSSGESDSRNTSSSNGITAKEVPSSVSAPDTGVVDASHRRNKRMRSMDVNSSRENGTVDIGTVNPIGTPNLSKSTSTLSIDPTPLPVETTLGSRQSTLFRFLSNSSLFRKGKAPKDENQSGRVPTYPLSHTNSNICLEVDPVPLQLSESSQKSLPTTSLPQQSISGMFSFSRWNQQQNRLMPPKEGEIGRTKVEELQQKKTENQISSNSGLVMCAQDHTDDLNNNEAYLPPPPKALAMHMSDWLGSFFGGSPNGEGVKKVTTAAGLTNENSDISSETGAENGLARSISSTLFGLVESPSMLMTSLKSGVTSLLGDPVATSVRRFPSGIFQSQQDDRRSDFLQQRFDGSIIRDGKILDGTSGPRLVLGQRHEQNDSLLDDFEETAMEKELRNA